MWFCSVSCCTSLPDQVKLVFNTPLTSKKKTKMMYTQLRLSFRIHYVHVLHTIQAQKTVWLCILTLYCSNSPLVSGQFVQVALFLSQLGPELLNLLPVAPLLAPQVMLTLTQPQRRDGIAKAVRVQTADLSQSLDHSIMCEPWNTSNVICITDVTSVPGSLIPFRLTMSQLVLQLLGCTYSNEALPRSWEACCLYSW